MRTLAITSPMQHGPAVRQAQQRLNKNRFKQDFMHGDIDGQFGPLTGRACIRAKYWLGYPRADQKPVYGSRLDGFLTGKRKLPDKFAAARKARLKKAKEQKPLRVKALEQARRDLGMKEHPANTNRCEITRRWRMTGPWCAMAVSLWYLDSGSKAFRHGVDWAYVPYLLAAAVDGRRGVALTSIDRIRPGDVVCFDWEQNGVADHVGLFEKWIRKGSTFRAIEGNTAVGNDSNGGQVMRRERNISQVARSHGRLGLIHVGR